MIAAETYYGDELYLPIHRSQVEDPGQKITERTDAAGQTMLRIVFDGMSSQRTPADGSRLSHSRHSAMNPSRPEGAADH